MDLPNRGNIMRCPVDLHVTEDGRIAGTARFRRFHLGRNGAVHGGSLAQLFDSLLGFTAFKLSESQKQRTAFLHVNYRKIVPIEKELQVDAGIDRIEGRKIFVAGRLLDGDAVLVRGRGAVRDAQAGSAVSRQRAKRALGPLARQAARPTAPPTSPTASSSASWGWRCSASASSPSRTRDPAGRSSSSAWRSWPPSSNGPDTRLRGHRRQYDRVMDWFKAQGLWVQALGFLLTAAVVVGTLWLLGRSSGRRAGRRRVALAEESHRPGVVTHPHR